MEEIALVKNVLQAYQKRQFMELELIILRFIVIPRSQDLQSSNLPISSILQLRHTFISNQH